MIKDEARDIESIRKKWDEHSERYDEWYKTFHGAVEHYVDWELLKGHLPKNRNTKILDAAGGTGRITLPLAKMGYSVTLCDISPKMLNVARQKLLREGVLDKVEICECDVHKLRFADESFDFVLCWDGMITTPKELMRVTKKGGKISIFLVNKYGSAVSMFCENPGEALALVKSKSKYVCHHEEKHMAVNVEEARELFKKEGIKVIEVYAVCGMLNLLSIPVEIQESRNWDEKFFKQVTEMLLHLSKETSTKGLSKHLVLYGEKLNLIFQHPSIF
ncbi:MAG: class I SAM-dependent methyltransferase [Candidatus Bathyarchaeota archaeon]|jgi:ubiquinone/menaquinone biosynthesis C-methylase UbiE|nr:class I SAM-dependent methyltransferase [Candidatus Bathyarchaeota archaeon A05DMB-5]MDH7558184.1 class I SAM-dependent methyltransferase [Candidatus Bathyarchaeota archaeon]